MMTHKLTSSGLALVAVLTISALGAPSASATDLFTSTAEKVWVTGMSHDHVLEFVEGPDLECTTTQFTGTFENGSEDITVLPSYKGIPDETPHTKEYCRGFLPVPLEVNHCHYELTGETTEEDEGQDAEVWIKCGEAPMMFKWTVGFNLVKLTIGSQTPASGGVTYENLSNHAGGSAVKVTITMTGITWSCEPTSLCTVSGVPHHGTINYTGTTILTGYEYKGSGQAGTNAMTTPILGQRVPIAVE